MKLTASPHVQECAGVLRAQSGTFIVGQQHAVHPPTCVTKCVMADCKRSGRKARTSSSAWKADACRHTGAAA